MKKAAYFLFLAAWMLAPERGFTQSYPPNFSQVQVATGITNPTAMAFAPDGRLFICLQTGAIRIFKNGALLGTNFASFAVDASGERGLLGLAFDPNFSSNQYLYIYYTPNTGSPRRNRLSRLTANGDVMAAGSESVLLDFDPLSGATNHNGGFLKFGPDGKLYVAIGENATPSNAQNYHTYHGKLLRLNADGSAPTDNPFYNSTPNGSTPTEQSKRVWALGLRNPFSFDVQPGTGNIFVNDVGQNTYEEIDDATASGQNFGWPSQEGTTVAGFVSPVYFYSHGSGDDHGCAITGGAFFNPASTNYPSTYTGNYFYLDYCNQWINRLVLSGGTVSRQAFATSLPGSAVCIATGPDGNLYFLSRGADALYRIQYSNPASAPVITTQPANLSVSVGQAATFSVTATGTAPLSYQWYKNNAMLSGATNTSYTIASAVTGDAGTYKVVVSNSAGSTTSNNATLTVTAANQPPTATINSPSVGTTYAGGNTISFSGQGTDPEQGNLPASAYTWSVDFHHDVHTHPGPSVNVAANGRSGSFVIPTQGETATNVFYRLSLTVRDANGATNTAYRDVLPRTSQISLASAPTGLQLTLDGTPVLTPYTFDRVEGVLMTLGAVSPQVRSADGLVYTFASWQHGGATTQTFATPVNNTTYTASFNAPLREPENPANTTAGLDYRYYEGEWNNLPNFDVLSPAATGTVGTFSLSPRNRNDRFGFVFVGFITIPADGQYDFFTTSDEGSRLYIGETVVVENDGLHSAIERSGQIGLKGGKHTIRVTYFEKTGSQSLKVRYDGPTITKQIIPASALFRSTSTNRLALSDLNGEGDWRVFPNPAGAVIKLRVAETFADARVRLYALSGKVIKETTLDGTEGELETDDLPGGTYLVQLQKGERIETRRVIVVK
ncbi:MAG: PQQ-dependent sugar dehydrogenase [Sphingobacteriaceae bacterium]|nr:PQQ-dependent sugar dehydrogenase [Cytophagaceae bacterium]